MNTQDLINQALDIASQPMRSTLGHSCGWLTFASHTQSGIEVEMGIWGPWNNPTKTRATFWHGSRRISRAVAESVLASYEVSQADINRELEANEYDMGWDRS